MTHSDPTPHLPATDFAPEQEPFAASGLPLRDWQWLRGELHELAGLCAGAGLEGPPVHALRVLEARLNDDPAGCMPLHGLRSRLGEGPQRERAEQDLQACIAAVQDVSLAAGQVAPEQQYALLERCGLIMLGLAATAGVLATAAGSPLFLCGLMGATGLFGLQEVEFARSDSSPGAAGREDLRRVVNELQELGLAMDEEDFLAAAEAEPPASPNP